MKSKELAALSLEQLQEQLRAAHTTGQALRFAHAVSPLENPMRLRNQRKVVARINTEISRRTKAGA